MNKFLILSLLSIFIFSCSAEKSGARISLENYLTHLKNEEFQKAYNHMSNNLKERGVPIITKPGNKSHFLVFDFESAIALVSIVDF
mgnify:CR=1 FL=1